MLSDNLKAELNRMERMGIITRVEQPAKWVSPIAVVKMPNGHVRIVLDPVDLNKAVKGEHYPIRTGGSGNSCRSQGFLITGCDIGILTDKAGRGKHLAYHDQHTFWQI